MCSLAAAYVGHVVHLRPSEAAYSCIPAPFSMPQLFPPLWSPPSLFAPLCPGYSALSVKLHNMFSPWTERSKLHFRKDVGQRVPLPSGVPCPGCYHNSVYEVLLQLMTRRTQLMFDVVIPGVYKEFGLGYYRQGSADVKYAPSAALRQNQNMCAQPPAFLKLKRVFFYVPWFPRIPAALPSMSSLTCSA